MLFDESGRITGPNKLLRLLNGETHKRKIKILATFNKRNDWNDIFVLVVRFSFSLHHVSRFSVVITIKYLMGIRVVLSSRSLMILFSFQHCDTVDLNSPTFFLHPPRCLIFDLTSFSHVIVCHRERKSRAPRSNGAVNFHYFKESTESRKINSRIAFKY